ncbi:ABC transporter ATP-binding protein [Occallatibacter savannae]|uniref:ABC transporter ATP-binding protein n=1 Tax=Occallatibacter savannae TaxID=1002691 RepID=UPI000D695D18|nr:ABC transporter ATP-binding protein [Occallatibacter savannae]
MLKELQRLLSPFRRGFAGYILLTLVRQALVVGGGYGLVLLIRNFQQNPARSVLIAFAVLVSYKLLIAALDQGMGWGFARHVSYPMFRKLSVDVFSKLLSLDQGWHQSGSSGARRGEITNGLSKFAQTSESLAREVCPLLATAFLSLFLLRSYVGATFWLAVLPAACAIFFWLSYEENRRCTEHREARYSRYASDYSLSIECMEMHADVVRYNQQDRMEQDYRLIHQDIESKGLAEARIQSWFGFGKSSVVLGLQAYLLCTWVGMLGTHRLDGAMLVYLYMLSEQLCGSLWGYASIWGRISEAWEPIKQFLRISSASSSLTEHQTHLAVPIPAQVALEFRDVEFGYRQGEPVLNRLNLRIEAGQKVGFIGRTGCGKSTLLKLVDRLYDAQKGSVFVGGHDVRNWPLRQLQRVCTCMSQNGGVFFSQATLLDTIRFARPSASFSEVIRAAKLACIHDEIMSLQDGYQTRAGEHGKNLSGGQRQRVAIAQALLSLDDPEKKIVLLDECTSNLDEETEAAIYANIWPLLQGKTVVAVTHRLSAIEHLVDEVVAMSEGSVAFRLNSAEIKATSVDSYAIAI